MSAPSLGLKTFRNFFFKRSKKRNQDEPADAVTIGDSATTGSPDYRHPPTLVYYPESETVGIPDDDYDLPLAIAISESENAAQTANSVDGGESQSSARYRASYSNGPSNHSEALSSQYYFNGIVDYDEHITDGFYDVWGEFNEVLRSRPFPSLRSLKKLRLEDGDLREVVLFSRGKDSVFPLIEVAARDAMLKLIDRGRVAVVQALAQIVSAQMGGAVTDERALVRGWQRCSKKLKRRYRSAVYPIGKLKVGLSRHRAFLYKVLADGLNVGCRLVRGFPYHPTSSQAVALVLIENTEVIVDLLIEPGRLLKLEGGGPDDVGTQVVFAEAPGMPSEPYWVPCFQKSSKKHPTLPEEASDDHQDQQKSSNSLPEGDGNKGRRQEAAIQPVPMSAFSTVQEPFDSMPNHGNLEIGRDDSSVISSNPRQNSDASSNSSMPVGMKTQNSGTSLFSESNGWTEEADSPRNIQRASHGTDTRTTSSRVPSHNLDEPRKSSTVPEAMPVVQTGLPPSAVSAFADPNWSLPIFDDDEEIEGDDRHRTAYHPESTYAKEDPDSNNKESSRKDASVSSFYDADYNVLESEIEIEPFRLGVGSYGEVFKGTWRGTEVAVKRLLEQDVSHQILEEFLLEVKIMKCLRHPNVLLFMGACMQPPNLAIVTEYLPRGSLYKLLHKTNSITDQRLKLRMARDVAKGMCYLHSFKPAIVHRDLKSPNLLVDKDWTVKVCDFGMSRMKANTYLSGKGTAGTPEWTAPEVLRNERSDEKCDVYSFGVILYELVTGLEPWANLKPMQVVGAVGFGGAQLTLPEEVDPRIAGIVKQCWSIDPQIRPSFSELLKMLSEFDSLPCLPKPT